MLNTAIFPVRYNDAFYTDITRGPPELAQFAVLGGLIVGAICSRLEAGSKEGTCRLYLMTLGVLATHRGMGIGSKLLQWVLDSLRDRRDVQEVYLHVQVNNTDALNFYRFVGRSMPRHALQTRLPRFSQSITSPRCAAAHHSPAMSECVWRWHY
ncbi:unnamed protein product [Chrysoparadoxa australica]